MFLQAKPGPAAAPSDAIAGALQRFGLKHPTRPVGVSKIDLASSFTQASSSPTMPSATQSAATSQPPNAATGVHTMHVTHFLCNVICADNVSPTFSRHLSVTNIPIASHACLMCCEVRKSEN